MQDNDQQCTIIDRFSSNPNTMMLWFLIQSLYPIYQLDNCLHTVNCCSNSKDYYSYLHYYWLNSACPCVDVDYYCYYYYSRNFVINSWCSCVVAERNELEIEEKYYLVFLFFFHLHVNEGSKKERWLVQQSSQSDRLTKTSSPFLKNMNIDEQRSPLPLLVPSFLPKPGQQCKFDLFRLIFKKISRFFSSRKTSFTSFSNDYKSWTSISTSTSWLFQIPFNLLQYFITTIARREWIFIRIL